MATIIPYTAGTSPADKIFTKAIWQAAGSPNDVELGEGWESIEGWTNLASIPAFQNTAITSIHIPASVISIGRAAFTGCGNLTTITFATGSKLEEIGIMAFKQNTSVTSIEIPASVTSIGNNAFVNCGILESVTFGTGINLAVIEQATFSNCYKLKSIIIPPSVTSIETDAFYRCQELTTVTFIASTNWNGGVFVNSFAFIATHILATVFIKDGQKINGIPHIVGSSYSLGGSNSVVFEVIPPPTCFPAGTPIQTDQGVTAIEQLVPGEHTLRGKSIIAITQTRPLQKHIVCFEKDSIGKNVPSQQTLCSKEHKVLYQGEMIKARDLADMCKNVKKVSYNGETLYNVLLEKHGKMLVNNMICETLHPENIAASFAKAKSSPSKRAVA